MSAPTARLLPDGKRLHLQHGPIDLIIGCDGCDRNAAFAAAQTRFRTMLQELVAELPLLRRRVGEDLPEGLVARRMHAAARSCADGVFVTPMAAVAGAVADEVLDQMVAAVCPSRAYVNNGGDIALHLATGQSYRMAIAGLDGADLGRVSVRHGDGIGGMATSGQGGRSLSMGIADSVTVLAASAATADVAATLIANAVDLPGNSAITRVPACDLDPDSDLGSRLVVRTCARLSTGEIAAALDRGADAARQMQAAGLIIAAALFLRGALRTIALPDDIHTITQKVPEHA